MNLFWINLIGYAGSFLLVGAYALNALGKLSSNSRLYYSVNGIGSLGLMANALYFQVFPSALTSFFWILVTSAAMVSGARTARKKRNSTSDETAPTNAESMEADPESWRGEAPR